MGTALGDFKKGLCALTPSAAASAIAVVHQLSDIEAFFQKAADDGAAGTATADTPFWTNPYDFNVMVTSGLYIPTSGGITADPANNATLSIKTDNGAGGATAVALSMVTSIADSASLVQNVAKTFTGRTPANVILVPGANLFVNIAKNGTGVVVRAGFFRVRLQRAE